ncbi:MAG: metalloregulator ArsR/SmtB family transcription factor [Ferroplasma sp.]
MEKIGDINIFKMLGDNTRLRIVKLLINKNMDVNSIVDAIKCDQPLVSHKLKELRENGIVMSYREGKNIVYKITDKSISSVIRSAEKAGKIIDYACKCVECDDKA